MFSTNVFLGGQTPPRFYRWANRDTTIFLQYDRSRPEEAKRLLYIGMSLKGTFCAESQPHGANGGFTHFHRLTAPAYAQGHGGPPGAQGYWLMWVAVDEFDASDGRKIAPGVDYGFSPTPPPSCGANVPKPNFDGPGAHELTRAEIRQLAGLFYDSPFRGGQKPTRFYRWVTGDTLIWMQFDNANLAKAKKLRYIGVAKRGTFCASSKPTKDFTSFQRLSARTFAKGRGGKAGTLGFWHLAVAVDDFRSVTRGVDPKFAVTGAPTCPKA
jgi:hypothetical protein